MTKAAVPCPTKWVGSWSRTGVPATNHVCKRPAGHGGDCRCSCGVGVSR